MILLHELPADDPRRNTPLRELNAECRCKLHSKNWRNVSKWKIGRATYNQLGPVWTELSEFRIPN